MVQESHQRQGNGFTPIAGSRERRAYDSPPTRIASTSPPQPTRVAEGGGFALSPHSRRSRSTTEGLSVQQRPKLLLQLASFWATLVWARCNNGLEASQRVPRRWLRATHTNHGLPVVRGRTAVLSHPCTLSLRPRGHAFPRLSRRLGGAQASRRLRPRPSRPGHLSHFVGMYANCWRAAGSASGGGSHSLPQSILIWIGREWQGHTRYTVACVLSRPQGESGSVAAPPCSPGTDTAVVSRSRRQPVPGKPPPEVSGAVGTNPPTVSAASNQAREVLGRRGPVVSGPLWRVSAGSAARRLPSRTVAGPPRADAVRTHAGVSQSVPHVALALVGLTMLQHRAGVCDLGAGQ